MADKITWPGWEIGDCIGKGGYGVVYEMHKEVFGDVERCALKVITIPKDSSEIEYMRCEGMDDDSITNTLNSRLGDMIREYKLMAQMRDNPNIVHCDDFQYTRHEKDLGWDIYIKMELLTPLMKCLDKVKTEDQIIRLGIEICNALVSCQDANILHRDIKPQNIFISPKGVFKLGDFGVARVSESTTRATVGVGTYSFMAPEVAKGEAYGATIDIYSLGLVLYWLLNEYRGPFLPPPPVVPSYQDNDEARLRRCRGEKFPPPRNGSSELKAIVMKACAYDPKKRYLSAREMLIALEKLQFPPKNRSSDSAYLGSDLSESDTAIRRGREHHEQQDLGKRLKKKTVTKNSGNISPVKRNSNSNYYNRAKGGKQGWLVFAAVLVIIGLFFLMQPWRRGQTYDERGDSADSSEITQTQLETEASYVIEETEPNYLDVSELSADVITAAEYHAKRGEYRLAIQIVEAAWEQYGLQECYDAAVKYRADFGFFNTSIIAAGDNNTIVVDQNGTTKIVGRNNDNELYANNWSDIIAVSLGDKHVVGLKSDGTVVAAGSSKSGRCNVGRWPKAVAICAGDSHTVAILADGSLVATGYDKQGQCDVDKLMKAAGEKRIVSIAAGYYHTLALLEDGTVVACGKVSQGACDVQEWKNVAAIYAGENFSIGLKTDGTIVAAGDVTAKWDLSQWTNIANLAAGDKFLIGVKSDGNILSAGLGDGYMADEHQSMYLWEDVVSVAAGTNHTVAVTREGKILSAGVNNYHQGDLDDEIIDISLTEESGSTSGARAVEVKLNHFEKLDGEFADIIGMDSNGNPLWSHVTDTYEGAQLSAITELGLVGDRYYYCEDGSVIALDSATGKVVWKNDDFAGRMPCYLINDGVIYLSGGLGPDFFAVDMEGNTLRRIESFDEGYYWPASIKIDGDKIAVYFEMGPQYEEYEYFVFHVDPNNFAYEYKGGISR